MYLTTDGGSRRDGSFVTVARGPRIRFVAGALAFLALVSACSDDGGDSDAASDATSTSEAPAPGGSATTRAGSETLRILVTNDDGIGAPGIDALVEALTALPDTEVTVIAPAENQSGSSDLTSVDPPSEPAATASGYEGTAVAGEPADTIVFAEEQGWTPGGEPHLVISGINAGQNVGPLAALSGTVGAARTAARLGVPAVAASQGLIQDDTGELVADYESGVEAVLAWLDEHRVQLLARDLDDDTPAIVAKIDVPTCPAGELRGSIDVPLAVGDQGVDAFAVDCESATEDPPNDLLGFVNGFVVVTELPVGELDSLLAG
jgi:5'-nucleotidase